MAGMRTLLTLSIVATAAFALTGAAHAQPAESSGTAVYVPTMTHTTDLPDGGAITRLHTKGYVMSDDAENPFRDSGQNCMGSGIGDVMNGYCDAVDGDGDMYWISWHNGPDGNTWRLIGGTGKFAGLSGGGTSTAYPPSADGQYRIDWTWVAD